MRQFVFKAFVFFVIAFNPTWASAQKKASVKPLKILLISDLNASYGSTHYSDEVLKVMGKVDSIKPDLILCAGDMVAGQKRSITKQQTEAMWQTFDQHVFQPISSKMVPFGFTIGNHDGSPNFAQDREVASNYWNKRREATGLNFVDHTHFPYYYSFIQNNVFIISWDASGSVVPENIYKWLEEQLALSQAKNADMRILLGHLPLYAVVEAKNKPGEVNSNPSQALAFFKEHKVDMYISGHQHAYYPAKKEGVYFLNAGAIGDGPRALIGHESAPQKAFSVLEISNKKAGKFSLKTINPTSGKNIALADLPQTVEGFNGKSKRIK